MKNVESGTCEFCQQEKEFLIANQFHGWYCEDCIKLVIYWEKESLKELREQKKLVRELNKK